MSRVRLVAGLSLVIAAATVWAAQNNDPTGPLPSILISRQLAEDLAIRVGEPLRLSADPAGAYPKEFLVAGIYEPTPDPMRINASKHEARLHLPDLESLAADPTDPFPSKRLTPSTSRWPIRARPSRSRVT